MAGRLPQAILDRGKAIREDLAKQGLAVSEEEPEKEETKVVEDAEDAALSIAPADDPSDEYVDLEDEQEDAGEAPEPQSQPQANLELEKANQRWKTLQGKFRSVEASLATAKAENEELRKALAEADKKANALQAKVDEIAERDFDNNVDAILSEEELLELGGNVSAFKKLAKAYSEPMRKQIASLEERRLQAEADRAKAAQQEFVRQFTKRVPDSDKIVAMPEWQAFLQKRERISGQKIGQIFDSHVANHDLESVVRVVDQFRALNAKQKAPTGISSSGASGMPQTVTRKPTAFAYSEYVAAKKESIRKPYDTQVKEKLEAITKKYEAARKAGMVDWNG